MSFHDIHIKKITIHHFQTMLNCAATISKKILFCTTFYRNLIVN